MKKIYIAGCGGMLGAAFYEKFSARFEVKCSDIDLNENWLTFLDFRDGVAYEQDVLQFKPDCLIHLGAHTDLEYCELNVDDAYTTNTLSVENAVVIANKLNIPLVFISTAGIFDGSKEVFDDWDTPNPLGHYARSKVLAENYVSLNANKYYIFRAGWMMGGGAKDKKFIKKILNQVEAGVSQLFIVNDRLGTPTYTHDFATNVIEVLNFEHWGTYNMVCQGATSRLDVVQETLSILGRADDIEVVPVTSDHFKQEYFAPRPPSERLVNLKLKLRGLDMMQDWRSALYKYITSDFSHFIK